MKQIDIIKSYQDKRCLIVDDMPAVRANLKDAMKSFGFGATDTAATSKDAIKLCQTRSYDLVICDYNLGPGQDGQQVLEELRYRKLLRNTSLFVMITAETSQDMVLGVLEYLPDDYLSKPITPSVLQNRLSKIIIRHLDLLPIKEAIDERDLLKAIDCCQDKLDSGGRYTGHYQRIKAELLYRLERHEEAQEIYIESLKQNKPVWAQLGLGKSYLAQQRYDEAEDTFKEVVATDRRFVEASDLLAEIYKIKGLYKRAQKALEDAIAASPKSPLRQRRLATMAKQNGDTDIALKARKSALQVGEHSCHYTPQDYFDMSAELLEAKASSDQERQKRIKDAEMYLKRAEKKHVGDEGIKVQTLAARSRLKQQCGKTEEAEALLERAKEQAAKASPPPLAQLELSQAMAALGDKIGADDLLLKTALANSDDADITSRADALADEPISQNGRNIASKLTKEGIESYDSKDYDRALEVFKQASGLFPKHVGLRLNIAQVALAKAASSGNSDELRQAYQENLDAVSGLSESHEKFPRYQHLVTLAEQQKLQ
ncbi:response regulator [Maricurvus nonylphenolicus]|uniref:response regulator n=1 Tax=Maricurvus nonylphenolicus TaxID=1008307 RepID=UPI0036F2D2B6